MAKFRLSAGAELDMLTKDELDDSLQSQWDREWTARGRGIKYVRLPVLTGTLTGTYPTSTTSLDNTCGPDQGYAWAIRRVAAAGLGTSDQLYIFRNSVRAATLLTVLVGTGTNADVELSGVQMVLMPGDKLIAAPGATFTASGTITVSGEAVEVPAELLWKLV